MEDFLKSTALGLGINPGLKIEENQGTRVNINIEKVGDDCFFFIF